MPVVNASHNIDGYMGSVVTKWMAMPQDSTGSHIYIPNHSDKTAQIFGTFGGCTVRVQGSNDETVLTDPDAATWWTVKNWEAEAMAKTTAGGWVITDNPIFIRVLTEGGDGTTSINVIICSKRG